MTIVKLLGIHEDVHLLWIDDIYETTTAIELQLYDQISLCKMDETRSCPLEPSCHISDNNLDIVT